MSLVICVAENNKSNDIWNQDMKDKGIKDVYQDTSVQYWSYLRQVGFNFGYHLMRIWFSVVEMYGGRG